MVVFEAEPDVGLRCMYSYLRTFRVEGVFQQIWFGIKSQVREYM